MELMNQTYELSALSEIADQLAVHVRLHEVVTFEGELGAGKTTLIKALCKALGVDEMVSSPTFALVNEYEAGNLGPRTKVYHIDLYRLEGEEEAVRAGMEDYLYSGDLCLVEWPQKALGIIPENALHVILASQGIDHRHIRVLAGKN
jgi:tRNA threonylcarbamoyladenosine biosynthesis protein TsaE